MRSFSVLYHTKKARELKARAGSGFIILAEQKNRRG
jgi:hypothetical protein